MSLLTSWIFFFGLLGGTVAGAHFALMHGAHAAVIVPTATVLAGVVLLLAQRARPFTESWRDYGRDLRVDLLHAVFSTGGVSTLVELALLGWLVSASSAVSGVFGGALWPAGWPMVAQLALALLIADLGAYWLHRLAHTSPLVWRIHALHHSSERLYSVNSARNHPLNVALTWFASLAPLIVLGAPAGVLLLLTVFTSVHAVIQHSNLDLRLGPLNWVFAGPELHRRHHHVTVERSGSNFGSNLIVWDVVFGTRALVPDEVNDEVGLPDMAFTGNFFTHLVSPFRLRRLARAPADALDAAAHAADEATRRVGAAAVSAVRRVVEVTNDFAAAVEPELAEVSGSGALRIRRE